MKIGKFYLLSAFLVLQITVVLGQNEKIEVPAFNDKYSGYVKQLEDGKTGIDYVDFRNSFLDVSKNSLKRIVNSIICKLST